VDWKGRKSILVEEVVKKWKVLDVMEKASRYVRAYIRGYLPDVDLILIERFHKNPAEFTVKVYLGGMLDFLEELEDMEEA